jgi:hypothetical protein
VFFEDGDVDAGAGEEIAEHDAGRASADDATGCVGGWRWVLSGGHQSPQYVYRQIRCVWLDYGRVRGAR